MLSNLEISVASVPQKVAPSTAGDYRIGITGSEILTWPLLEEMPNVKQSKSEDTFFTSVFFQKPQSWSVLYGFGQFDISRGF